MLLEGHVWNWMSLCSGQWWEQVVGSSQVTVYSESDIFQDVFARGIKVQLLTLWCEALQLTLFVEQMNSSIHV